MGLNPGALRHRVYLQTLSRTEDAGGGGVESWSDMAAGPTWASIDPLTGSEALRAQQLQATVTHRIEMRWREGVTPAIRIRWNGRYFEVRMVINPEERRERLELLAEEVTA